MKSRNKTHRLTNPKTHRLASNPFSLSQPSNAPFGFGIKSLDLLSFLLFLLFLLLSLFPFTATIESTVCPATATAFLNFFPSSSSLIIGYYLMWLAAAIRSSRNLWEEMANKGLISSSIY